MLLSEEDRLMKRKLLDIFPDGNVTGISKLCFKDEFRKIRVKSNMKLKEYITDKLELNYIAKVDNYSVDKIYNNLLVFYPEKNIETIELLKKEHQALYLSIRKYCKKNNISTIDYLTQNGFSVNNNNIYINLERPDDIANTKKVIYSSFDVFTLKRVKEEYSFNSAALSNYFGNSRSGFAEKLKVKKVGLPSWSNVLFDKEETEFILKYITKRETQIDAGGESNNLLFIYFGLKNKKDIAILTRYNGIFKCHFEFDEIIKEKLKEFGYLDYYEKDFLILREIILFNQDKNNGSVTNLLLTNADLKNNSSLDHKIRARCKRRGISPEDYLKEMNVELIRENLNLIYTEEKIISMLKSYINEEGYVDIPIKDKDYHILMTLAKRKGYGNYSNMIHSLGFKYVRKRHSESDSQQEHIDLLERYRVDTNRIYINSLDPIYNRLTSYCNKRNLKLNNYLKTLGFKRVSLIKELPLGYEQYDWKKERSAALRSNVNTKIETILNELADENNEVYLDTNTNSYSYITKISIIREVTVNSIIEKYGYIRIYKSRDPEKETIKITKEELVDESDESRISRLLEELKELDNTTDKYVNKRTTVVSDKKQRNALITKKLKNMYSWRCQLCSDTDKGLRIPVIEGRDGNPYVEMHHIRDLANDDKDINGEDINLDTYTNGIVLCCFHHKYVHLGGYKELIKDKEGNFYLKPENGEPAKLYLNEHLDLP